VLPGPCGYYPAMTRILVLATVLAACSGGGGGGAGGGKPEVKIGPTPEPFTRAVLAGPLCGADGSCKCRDENLAADGGAGVPEGDLKRYEFRVGPIENDLWVTVDGQVLYKSKERATDCFYLDLATGEHQVDLRASKPLGTQVGLRVSEYGPKAGSWYKTFRFDCGVNGACAHGELDDIKAEFSQVKAGVHDKCGSTKVKGIAWDTGVAPDQVHPQDVAVRFTLSIYKFLPDRPTGDPACGTGDAAPVEPPKTGPDEPDAM
jgi:hypothetical protein